MVKKSTDLRAAFRADRWAAHEILFARRHEEESGEIHRLMVADFWSVETELVTIGFRGAGKTTLLEEDLCLAVAEGAFRFCLIVGSKAERASEPLAAIKNEVAMNELFREVYGDLVGETWTQTKAVFAGGQVIQAIGRDQDIRGIKHLDWRPDLIVAIDFEDKDTVQTQEGRRATLRWFLAELLPACDRSRRRVRVQATLMNSESVPALLIKESKWASRYYPIMYLDEGGEYRSSWPAKFPVAQAHLDRMAYVRLGEADLWDREFMCLTGSEEARVFRREDLRVVPRVRVWEGVWAMVDPARTKLRTSSSTGWAVWSWLRNRLVVWDAGAELLLPDEIIDRVFAIDAEFRPIEVGVEEDGLNEFLLQPLRHEQLRRRVSLPVRGVRAPRGKLDFIRSLQPFFRAGEVEFAKPLEALVEQLLGFPTGRIDGPNALAYAILGRPGLVIYDGFDPREHVVGEIRPAWGKAPWLACNAKPGLVTAVLVQYGDGVLEILADWMIEGDPGQVFEDIAREASMLCGAAPRAMCGEEHWQQYRNVGLVQAAKACQVEIRYGGLPMAGREFLAAEFERHRRQMPVVQIAENARWILNALAGGYARPASARGFGAEPVENRYRVLMEGLESFAAMLSLGSRGEEDDDGPGNWAYAKDGTRYRSAMPQARRH